jgi:xanthine dehydrogenase accessory factor
MGELLLEIHQEIINVISKRERAVLATIISSDGSTPRKAGAKMLIKEDGSFVGTVGGGGTEQKIRQKVVEVIKTGISQIVHFDLSGKDEALEMICGGKMDIFLEPIIPTETLYLFGAGHTSQSTGAIAKTLGFQVFVIDPRPEYNNSARFPDVDSLIVEDYETAFSKLNVDENSYIVIYTTGHVVDEQCLRFAVNTGARYIGMIGSKKKAKEVKENLLQDGISRQQIDRIHSPIGVEINAETPGEIAISILAEIIKVRHASV